MQVIPGTRWPRRFTADVEGAVQFIEFMPRVERIFGHVLWTEKYCVRFRLMMSGADPVTVDCRPVERVQRIAAPSWMWAAFWLVWAVRCIPRWWKSLWFNQLSQRLDAINSDLDEIDSALGLNATCAQPPSSHERVTHGNMD